MSRHIVILLAFFVCASPATAGLIRNLPDIDVGFVTTSYTNGELSFSGAAMSLLENADQISDPTNNPKRMVWRGDGTMFLGQFTLNANIDQTGTLGLSSDPNENRFKIVGALAFFTDVLPLLPGGPTGQVDLLKGSITSVESDAAKSGLVFTATVDSDSDLFPSFGNTVKITLGSFAANTFDFNAFGPPSMGVANVGRPVPEPGTMVGFGMVLGLVVFQARRKRSAA